MTTPPQPPPGGYPPPGQPGPYPPPPQQHGPYPPQQYTPTSGAPQQHPGFYPPPPPPRKKSFWSSTGGILTIVFGSIGLVVLLCGGLAVLGQVGDSKGLSKIDVQLTSCGGSESVAKVGYSVTNNGDRARRVTLELEYRDSSGARLDTDTAYVGEVPAGDTVRGEESTILNASESGTITCKVTKVR